MIFIMIYKNAIDMFFFPLRKDNKIRFNNKGGMIFYS